MLNLLNKFIEKWAGWDEFGEDGVILYQAKFKEDFGPWKKGEVHDIRASDDIVESYDAEGKVLLSCKVKLAVDA